MDTMHYIQLQENSSRDGDTLGIDSVVDNLLRQAGPTEETPFPELLPVGEADPSRIDPQDRPQLIELYSQLLSQYLDPIAQFMNLIRRESRNTATLESFKNLLLPVLQLTETLEVTVQKRIIESFLLQVDLLLTGRGPLTYREIEPLNELFDRLLNSLGARIRDQYLSAAFYQRNSNPLLEEIRRVKYIGPRRLQRLYAVGLVTVDAISRATPDEIVEVTGLPRRLSEQVIEVTRSFMVQQRTNRREHVRRLCDELSFELKSLLNEDRNLLREVLGDVESLHETMSTTLSQISRHQPTRARATTGSHAQDIPESQE